MGIWEIRFSSVRDGIPTVQYFTVDAEDAAGARSRGYMKLGQAYPAGQLQDIVCHEVEPSRCHWCGKPAHLYVTTDPSCPSCGYQDDMYPIRRALAAFNRAKRIILETPLDYEFSVDVVDPLIREIDHITDWIEEGQAHQELEFRGAD